MGNYLLLIGGQHVNDCLLGAKDPRQPPAVEGNRKGKGCGCPFGLEDGEKGNGVLWELEEHEDEGDDMDLA